MRIVVAGGTGFVGSALCARLAQDGHGVQVLSRHPEAAAGHLPSGVEPVGWDPSRQGGWVAAVAAADAVVNLAGESVAEGRWSPARKVALRASRLQSTDALVSALAQGGRGRPRVLVNASAVGYYGDRGSEELTEASSAGRDFLARLCVDWEAAARRAETEDVRVVLTRFGIVLGRSGALPRLALPFRFWVGGPLGDGRQWVSWIHYADAVGMIRFALDHDAVRGPVNVVAPRPVPERELAAAVGRALGRPSWLPAPARALRLALGEMADVSLLAGQRALPAAALHAGYAFAHGDIQAALRDVL